VRYLLRAGLIDFHSIRKLLGIAATHGRHSLIGLFVEIGAKPAQQNVIQAMYADTGSSFLAVQGLLKVDIALNETPSLYCDYLAKLCCGGGQVTVKYMNYNMTVHKHENRIMTVLLILSELKNRKLLDRDFGVQGIVRGTYRPRMPQARYPFPYR
jgi:hypothetical protein